MYEMQLADAQQDTIHHSIARKTALILQQKQHNFTSKSHGYSTYNLMRNLPQNLIVQPMLCLYYNERWIYVLLILLQKICNQILAIISFTSSKTIKLYILFLYPIFHLYSYKYAIYCIIHLFVFHIHPFTDMKLTFCKKK